MRRPNGTGTIVKLPGNRRRPYAVRISARDKYGQVVQKPIGYHATAKEAQVALDEYNAARAAGAAPAPDKAAVTLGAVYEQWSARKYARANRASIVSYRASWGRVSRLAALKMRDVTLDNLQAILDEDEAVGLSNSSISNDHALIKALFAHAMQRDIISRDHSQYLQVPHVGAKHEKGAFTDLQMKRLEELAASGVPGADTVLMLCYTGWRISEFLSLTPFSYHKDGDYLMGGMKTAAGKDRIVPVHPKIRPYLLRWLSKGGQTIICAEDGSPLSAPYYRNKIFPPIMEAIGCPQATPHWCRHTFATRAKISGVDEFAIRRILGHATKDITEHYTHSDITWLSQELKKVS